MENQEYKDPREALREELNCVELSEGLQSALFEMSYTAEEGGLIDIRWSDDESGRNLVKLVLLAIKYENNFPEHFVF